MAEPGFCPTWHLSPEAQTWAEQFCNQAQGLSPETIAAFTALYAPEAVFSDPFHTLQGRAAIAQAYGAMFQSLVNPQFSELQPAWADAHRVAIGWKFRFAVSPRSAVTEIAGTSWLRLDPASLLILRHEDHWDASAFFGAFAGLGGAVRWLKSRVAHAGSVTRAD